MYLKKLSLTDGIRHFHLLQAIGESENGFKNEVKNDTYAQFQQWLNKAEEESHTNFGNERVVPQTTYWLWDEGQLVGIGRIRHRLNDKLAKSGGNLASAIAKNKRDRGYGNRLLDLLLRQCKELNVNPIQCSVQRKNVVSNKIVLKNGGHLYLQTNTENIYRW